jgi:hypothetical protein
MVLDPADKAHALGAAQVIAMYKAAQESDVERDGVWGAVVVDAEWVDADAERASTPIRKIPGSEPNSATCKPPLRN